MRFDRIIHSVSGRGLLLGIEFANTEIGYKVVSGLFRRGVLVAGTLTNSKVVRIEPALNIPDKLLDAGRRRARGHAQGGRRGDARHPGGRG